MEISLLFIQLLFVFAGIILVPLLWYTLVNRISLKEMFTEVQLRREGSSHALLWGFITVIFAFAFTLAIGLLYMYFTKMDPSKLSNIPDLNNSFLHLLVYSCGSPTHSAKRFSSEGSFSIRSPRSSDPKIAMVTTSVLFGLSHLSYGMAYTAVMAGALGVIFAVVVMKTKNLYPSIFAHIAINVISITVYFFGKSLGL